jgi:sugar phosphate isomerase/epimerase
MHQALSVGWLTLPRATPVEFIDAAGAAGFASVGIRLAPPPGDPQPPIAGNAALLRDIDAALRHRGVALHEMGGIWLNGPRPSSWCLPALEAGARLGARYAIALITEPDPVKRLADFVDLCEAAATFGIGIAIEFVKYSAVKTIEGACDLVMESGMRNASILADALHLYRSGGNVESLRRIPPELVTIAQLCDAPAQAPADNAGLQYEARHDRLDPGLGGLDLHGFVAAVPPGLVLELEIPCLASADMSAEDRLKQAMRHTREFLASGPTVRPGLAR